MCYRDEDDPVTWFPLLDRTLTSDLPCPSQSADVGKPTRIPLWLVHNAATSAPLRTATITLVRRSEIKTYGYVWITPDTKSSCKSNAFDAGARRFRRHRRVGRDHN